MDVAMVAEISATVIGLGTIIFSAGRITGKFTESMTANTKATEKLSEVIDGHLVWSAQVVKEHEERFHEHDNRLTALEAKKR